jgi:sporulation protein YlmC with PRC-barrel domain
VDEVSGLKLVHDVLDAQLVDRKQRKIGRVDSLVLALEEGRPPRVAAILVGGPVRAHRIGRWALALERVLRSLGRVRRAGVSTIPFDAVRCIGDTIQVDVDGDALESNQLEAWLAEHVICRIPGAGTGEGADRK